jgi:23S rRNA pseudouridine2605 synthase
MMRLQKYLAEAGVASRRAAERMILDGRVAVNGSPVRELGTKVESGDRVAVDGDEVRARRKIYVAVNKPPGCVCTRRDPEKRWTLAALLPPGWSHLFPVGRLDYESEGLIFLTNDGDFCLRLTHPRYGVRKTYEAWVEGRAEPDVLARLTRGVQEGGERLKAEQARIVSSNNTRSVMELVLAEGRNREVRRLLGALGLEVTRLVRTRIGRISLGDLGSGRWRTLTETEIESLLGNYENKTMAFNRPGPGADAPRNRKPDRGGRDGYQRRRQAGARQAPGPRAGRGAPGPRQRARPGRHQQ